MAWTRFMDMYSGGRSKLDWEHIYIEAGEDEAKAIFYSRFGRNPERVTCTCCGPDYSISSGDDLAQLTGFRRGCASGYVMPDGSVKGDDWWYSLPLEERGAANATFRYLEQPGERAWEPYQTLEEYMKRKDVTFIPASHIKDEDRRAQLPAEDYVWVG